MTAPRIGPRALYCIRHFEGVKLRAYRCPAGKWTIGYGHTRTAKPGLTISLQQAEALLREDVREFEEGVHAALAGAQTVAREFGAMVSLAFNIGLAAFRRSSVLRHHRAGDKASAAAAFGAWRMSGGRILPGLVTRRKAERLLYEGDFEAFDRLTLYRGDRQ